MGTIAEYNEAQDAKFGPLPAGWGNARPSDLVACEQFLAHLRNQEWDAALRFTSGSSHSDVKDLWSSLMTAHFGTVGLHQSYRGADDRPDFSKMSAPLAQRIRAAMDEAVKRINRWLDPAHQAWVVRIGG